MSPAPPPGKDQHPQVHGRLLGRTFVRWALYAIMCYLGVSALLAPFLPRQEMPAAKVYPATPMQPETAELTIYDALKSVCLRKTFSPRNSTLLKLPLDILDGMERLEMKGKCLAVQELSALWSRERGLMMDPFEYWYYREKEEQGLPIEDDELDWFYEETGTQKTIIHDDDIELFELCQRTNRLMRKARSLLMGSITDLVEGFAHDGFSEIRMWAELLAMREKEEATSTTAQPSGTPYTMTGPPGPPTPDPRPLRTIRFVHVSYNLTGGLERRIQGYGEDVSMLGPTLHNAIQHIDQVIDISRHVTKNVTDELTLREKLFGPDLQTKALRDTKASIAFFSEVRHNMSVVLSAIEGVIEEQDDILREERRLLDWIQRLMEDGWMSGAGPHDDYETVRLPNDTDSFILAGKTRPNAWAVYRPRSEKDELGMWCVYPGCPPATGETVLVRLHLPNPTDALRALSDVFVATFLEKDLLSRDMRVKRREYEERVRGEWGYE
ncbi:hypothetical protein N0V84_012446 [Fusarium piperis]|uniref:Uncharacterized protein n=1 Tax=Fusarium piperis TaxID=1435070 RepID=A0A9W8TCH6_9HYPO|nr:hypothetical protein N0V84_012446 [Fusarium piperis]